MKEDWLEHYTVDKPPSDVMCAYKLIKVEFRYWGMQVSKFLNFIFIFGRFCFKPWLVKRRMIVNDSLRTQILP